MNQSSMSFISSILFSVIIGANNPSIADTISLRADEWCPYNCVPNSDKPGYMIEIAKKIFEAAGHQVDYQTLNWARAIEETRAAKFNGIVGASKGDAPDFIFPMEKLGISVYAFAVRKDNSWSFTGMDSLNGKVLGVIRNYSYGDTLNAYVEANKNDQKKIQISSGDSALEINLRKLNKGRLDAVVEGLAVLTYTIGKLGLDQEVKIAGTDATADPVFIAFTPAHPKSHEYADLLSKGIMTLRTNGQLKEILTKYGQNDWQ
ncbi:Transporter substrate-binding domain-containing protein [Gammaproteobacteria bacterium]